MFDPIAAGASIETFDDAGALAFFLAEAIDPPAPAFVVVLDGEHRTTGPVLVTDADEAVVPLLELAASVAPVSLLAVSDQAGGSRCDPDDAIEWEEAHGAVAAAGGHLLDWIVLAGDLAISKARYAPTPGLAGPPPADGRAS